MTLGYQMDTNHKIYDAFISYSREDEAFAAKLELQLERYRIPKHLSQKRRHLNIFRDVQDIVGNELPDAIREAIENSSYLIVLCSPHSRASSWVGKEIDEFVDCHGKEYVIPVLIGGRPNLDVPKDDVSQDQAFHETLYKYFSEPLAADFRSFESDGVLQRRVRRIEAKFQVLALLLKTDKESLIKRQRKRTIRWLVIALALSIFLTVAFAWIAYVALLNAEEARKNAEEARQQRDIAVARMLASEARREALYPGRENQELSGLLIAGSLARTPTAQGFIAWRQAMERLPQLSMRYALESPVVAAAQSETEAFAALGTSDGKLALIDLNGSDYPFVITLKGPIQAVALSPADRWLAVATGKGMDSSITIYANAEHLINKWLEVKRMPVNGRVKTLKFFPVPQVHEDEGQPASQWLAAGLATDSSKGKDRSEGSLRIWNSADWAIVADYVMRYRVIAIDFSPDGRLIVTGTGKYTSGALHVLELPSLREIFYYPTGGNGAVEAVAFSKTQDQLIATLRHQPYQYRKQLAWNTKTWLQEDVWKESEIGDVDISAFSEKGNLLATAHENTVRTWTKDKSKHWKKYLDLKHPDTVWNLAFGKYNLTTVSGEGNNRRIHIWSTLGGGEIMRVPHNGGVNNVLSFGDPPIIVSGSRDGVVRTWKTPNLPKAAVPESGLHSSEARISIGKRKIFHPKEELWATVGYEDPNSIILGAGSDNNKLGILKTKSEVTAFAFNPNDRKLASGHKDGFIRVWDADTATLLFRYRHDPINGPANKVSLTFSGDGKRIAVVNGNDIHIWESTKDRLIKSISVKDEIRFIRLNSTGDQLAAVSWRGIQIWDVETGEELQNFYTRTVVDSVAFSHDNEYLAWIGNQSGYTPDEKPAIHNAGIWQLSTGQGVASIFGATEFLDVGFSQNDKVLITKRKAEFEPYAYPEQPADIVEAHLWQSDDLIPEICRRIDRDISHDEWYRYFGEEKFEPICLVK